MLAESFTVGSRHMKQILLMIAVVALVGCWEEGTGSILPSNTEATNPDRPKPRNRKLGNLKRSSAPPPPSDLMARFTSGQWTKSSMPSMARVGSSYGNLKREVCVSSPAIGSDGTVYVGSGTKSSMPSMARVGSSYGNLKREVCVLLPRHRTRWHGLRRVNGQQALCH